MSEPLLDLREAHVHRGSTHVFRGLTLRIEQGQNTAILGPNGAGKTTLLKLLSRELYPERREGSYLRILGRERWNIFELRRELGVVSNELQASYAPAIRGFDVALSGFFASVGVHDYRHFDTEQMARVDRSLAELGIAGLRDTPFGRMSAGEQRRFLLARALVHRPHTLILDEPTTSLDIRATFELLAALRRLMQAGRTLVFVTHHLHEIPPEVEHVVLLRDGEVFAEGPKMETLTEKNLRDLFRVPLRLVTHEGHYQALPI